MIEMNPNAHRFLALRTGPDGVLNADFPHYRGVARLGPPHVDALPDDHVVNKAFLWHAGEWADHGGTSDLPRLRELVRVYENVAPDVELEIIEVDNYGLGSVANGSFLGTDLATLGDESLLANGMLNLNENERITTSRDAFTHIVALFLRDRLNGFGLVDRHVASCASQAMELLDLPEEISGCIPRDVYLIDP